MLVGYECKRKFVRYVIIFLKIIFNVYIMMYLIFNKVKKNILMMFIMINEIKCKINLLS